MSRLRRAPWTTEIARAGIGTMRETASELEALQRLIDASFTDAGAHLRGIISEERRVDAAELVDRLQGMRLLVVATTTADGRPIAGPVDGYFLHGCFYFSSARNSVRMRHLAARPFVTATHLPGEEFAVSVHGRAEIFELADPEHGDLKAAMLDHYLPLQGPAFGEWLDGLDALGTRIDAHRIFTFQHG